ncbi:MAG: phosphopentomutase [Pseudomonadota bacterium]
MPRAFLIVLDSVGCGGAPDAAAFGDAGANTLAHIAQACAQGRCEEGRGGALHLPNLDRLGLGAAIDLASGAAAPGLGAAPQGAWGAATQVSNGKDTPSGHWELAGVPVPFDWHYFARTQPAFPVDLMETLCARAGLPGTLCNAHGSGVPVIDAFGAEHLRTGAPICYTSVDSVFQIAAHEEAFGLDRLYDVCRVAAEIFHPLRVGRVIARPFLGEPGVFERTVNRRDYAIAPPQPTLCDRVVAAGRKTIAIGKIGDIFAHQGISAVLKGDDATLFDHLLAQADTLADGDLVFANFVEFDSLYGHRRDVAGYARALEGFDARLPAFLARLRPGDLAIFSADHGNDPTWPGTDHTRERVPVLMTGPGLGPKALGSMGFVDVAATVLAHLGLPPGPQGRAVL